MGLEIEDRGFIYDAAQQPPGEQIACCTSLLPLTDGACLAAFQVGPEKHGRASHVRLYRSVDGGSKWSMLDVWLNHLWQGAPGSLTLGETVEVSPGRIMLAATWFDRSDPDRPMFDPVTEGLLRSRQLKAFSSDSGDTWTEWEEVPTPNLTGCAISGPILSWPDGRLAVSFESFKEYDDGRPVRHASWLLPTTNGGGSFRAPVKVAHCPRGDVFYWDQRLSVGREPGEFIGLFWTHDRSQKKDLTVHACAGTLGDEGLLNFDLWDTAIPGQIAAPLMLPDGRWLAAVVDRRRPAEIRLWSSRDGGRRWPIEESMVIHAHEELAKVTQGTENVDFVKYWEDFGKWSFGHPALRMLDERHVLMAFYAGDPTCMSGHWVRLRVQ